VLLLGIGPLKDVFWNLRVALTERTSTDTARTTSTDTARATSTDTATAAATDLGLTEIANHRGHCEAVRTSLSSRNASAVQADGGTPDSITPGSYAMEEYKTAAKEIRERLSIENLLFALKFTLVGAIIWMLFTVFGRRVRDFGRFAHDRRAAVFIIAALLSSVIVDTRLRFNAKVTETIGDWIFCIEEHVARTAGSGNLPPMWEHFLHLELDSGSLPIMRYLCHSLTPLLYAVALYLFVMLARTIHRSTLAMIEGGGGVFFGFLWLVAYSHSSITFPSSRRERIVILALPCLLAMGGWLCLFMACRRRFAFANVFWLNRRVILEDPPEHEEEKTRMLKDLAMFGLLHQHGELREWAKNLDEHRQIRLRTALANLIEETVRNDALGWDVKEAVWWALDCYQSRLRLLFRFRLRTKREWPFLSIEKDFLRAWKNEKAFRKWRKENRYESDLAEDRLWMFYFGERAAPVSPKRGTDVDWQDRRYPKSSEVT
jgi:hypothetical protein